MAIIGEAFITIRPRMAGFAEEVRAESSGAFSKLEGDAAASGSLAGSGLRKGVSSEAGKIEGDLAAAGESGGSRFGKALDKGFSGLTSTLGSFGVPMHQFSQATNEGGQSLTHLQSAGRLASMAVAGVAVGFAAYATDSAVKFQNLTTSLAAQAGISTKAATAIGDAMVNTGGKTVFSAAQQVTAYTAVASQLASVQGHALSTSQAMAVMRSAGDLAEASGLNLNDATAALAKTMQTFGISASGAANAANVLYEAGRQTGLGVTQVTMTFQKLHSQLGIVTPPIGQLGGVLVDMANHGETGRAAISGLSTAMTHLMKPASDVQTAIGLQQSTFDALSPHLQKIADSYKSGTLTSAQFTKETSSLTTAQKLALTTWKSSYDSIDKAKQKLADLGVTIDNSHGKFVGMAAVIAQLHDKIQGMTEAQKLATLTAAFGAGAAQRMLSIVEAGPAAYAKATAAVTRHNAASDAAAKMNKSLGHEFDLVKTAVEDFAVKVGSVLVPIITGLLSFLLSHKDVLIAIAGIIGGALTVAIYSWVASLFAAEGALAPLAATITALEIPVLAVIAVLAALGIAAYELYKHWDAVWGFIKQIAADAWHFIYDNVLHPIMQAFSDVVSWITSHWELLAAILLAPFAPVIAIVILFRAHIIDAFEAVGRAVMAVIDWFRRLPGDIVRALGDFVATIFHALLSAINWIETNLGAPLRSWFVALPSRIVTWLGDLVSTIFHVMLTVASWFDNNVGQPLVGFFSRLPGRLARAVGNIVGTIFSGLLYVGGWLEANVLMPILHWFESLPGRIAGAIFGGGAGATGPHGYPAGGRYGTPGGVVPHAAGGITHGPTVGLFGEAGSEALIPLRELPKMVHDISVLNGGLAARARMPDVPTAPNFASLVRNLPTSAATGTGGNVTVTVQPGAVSLTVAADLSAESRAQAELLHITALRQLRDEMRAGAATLRSVVH